MSNAEKVLDGIREDIKAYDRQVKADAEAKKLLAPGQMPMFDDKHDPNSAVPGPMVSVSSDYLRGLESKNRFLQGRISELNTEKSNLRDDLILLGTQYETMRQKYFLLEEKHKEVAEAFDKAAKGRDYWMSKHYGG